MSGDLIGTWHLWEPALPHARALVKVTAYNRDTITTIGWDLSDGSLGRRADHEENVNEVDRFWEATEPIPELIAECILAGRAAGRAAGLREAANLAEDMDTDNGDGWDGFVGREVAEVHAGRIATELRARAEEVSRG